MRSRKNCATENNEEGDAAPGCPLYEDIRSGKFEESTVEEFLDEEEIFLKHLELNDCDYFGLHPSNIVPLSGLLSRDKDELLRQLQKKKDSLSAVQLSSKPVRSSEGAVII